MEDNTGMTHQGSNASNPSSTSHPSNHSSHTNTANNTTTAKEDVYEFKASKDAPSNTTSRVEDLKAHEAGEGSAAGSSSSGASGPHETTSTGAEKRPFAPGEESSNSSSCSEEDHRARKKAKKEEIASASSTNKVGRCSRGNSMEKVSPKTRSALSSSDGSPKSKEEFEGAEEEGGGPEESGSKIPFLTLKFPHSKLYSRGTTMRIVIPIAVDRLGIVSGRPPWAKTEEEGPHQDWIRRVDAICSIIITKKRVATGVTLIVAGATAVGAL
ncbi:Hypothetical protein FKW44_021220 [Caligus rogercresseyi]|uniref:Uncharacterized protein n=1 Tax=Caligus rogercresseyi TaxID=217165 RepID=A0A7T8GR26_CALRO|nr:Hypothetical protein FKW44_021220 [Caligus rogercresseyi]